VQICHKESGWSVPLQTVAEVSRLSSPWSGHGRPHGLFAKSNCRNLFQWVPLSGCPDFTLQRVLAENKLKLELRTIARSPSRSFHLGILFLQTV
jgi:hypothetical protein